MIALLVVCYFSFWLSIMACFTATEEGLLDKTLHQLETIYEAIA